MTARRDPLDDELVAVPMPDRRSRVSRVFVREREDGRRVPRFGWSAVAVILGLIGLYYLIGGLWIHEVDADPDLGPVIVNEAGSEAVAMAAALIEREVDDNGWVANDPFFLPGAVLDNMANFQQGLVYALSRFVIEMSDQLGRARGSSQVDPALDRATGLLRYPGDIWLFDFSTSLAPTASSEEQYRAAQRALADYNQRLAAGEAVFDRRADNLLRTIDRIAADLGSSSAIIAEHLHEQGGWLIDFDADEIFYTTKGRLYGYYMVLDALGRDFDQVIDTVGVAVVWQEMLDSLRAAVELSPLMIVSGDPDSQLLPSHLASQGFFLLRARTQMREISDVLRN